MKVKSDSRRERKKNPINQVHIEKIGRRQWYLITSDARFFFRPKYTDRYIITTSALKRLRDQIDKVLKEAD